MNHFGGISVGLMTIVLLLLMIMCSLTDGIKITVKADEHIFKKLSLIKTNTITVEVNGSDKVEDLKKKIMEKMENETKTKIGTDPKRLTLQYDEDDDDDDDDVLEDGKTIDDYPIKEGDILHLSIGDVQIVVQYKIEDEVKRHGIWVNGKENVAILKKKIRTESGIEPDDQILRCNENGPIMENNNKLEHYDIDNDNDPTIFMSYEFEILVKYTKGEEEKQYTVWVKGTDTVATLKQKIMAIMQDQFNTLTEDIRLSCSPTVEATVKAKDGLNNDSKTMEEYGISEGKAIYILSAFQQRRKREDIKEKGRFELVYYN
ncbi:hypothetical protein niasHS_018145 [Heterodera schachtii]|uniref:Ubiquitin-like domain-containing protein n=1 Tax=Heterodera schachtii TaxID=97005 RepID=A0ABD2HXB3_HETSC